MERLQQLNDELSVELQSHELQKMNLSDTFRAELTKKEVSHLLFASFERLSLYKLLVSILFAVPVLRHTVQSVQSCDSDSASE